MTGMMPLHASVRRVSSLWQAYNIRRAAASLSTARPCLMPQVCKGSRFMSAVPSSRAIDDLARKPQKQRSPPLSTPTTEATDDGASLIELLEQAVTQRDPGQALAYFNCLETPPTTLTSQKLAILLAKQGAEHQTRRAHEILQAVYGAPTFTVDDYTQLASIYVVDACLRQGMLEEAKQIFANTNTWDIALDVPAYTSLIHALVAAEQLSAVKEALRVILAKNLVVLPEQTFHPAFILMAKHGEFGQVMQFIDQGRRQGVTFTFETYDPLVELAEEAEDTDSEELWETLENFMKYINRALEEDGFSALSADNSDDDDDAVIQVEYNDEDDDDDGEDDDFDDDHSYR